MPVCLNEIETQAQQPVLNEPVEGVAQFASVHEEVAVMRDQLDLMNDRAIQQTSEAATLRARLHATVSMFSTARQENQQLVEQFINLQASYEKIEQQLAASEADKNRVIEKEQRTRSTTERVVAENADQMAHLRELLHGQAEATDRARKEATEWRDLFLQECESVSNNECASEKCCRQPEAYPSKLLELPRSHTADQDTTTTPGEDWTVPPYCSPTPQCEPLKAGNATVNQPNLDVSAASDFTTLASEFVGAMTQALRSSDTQGIGDSGGNTDMKRLASRQSSVNTKLPIFSGKAEEWPSFINLYRNTTQQCGFTDGENVQRLQAALKGPAKDAVQLILAL